MTNLALLRNAGRHVIGIRRPLEILKVTRNAGRRGYIEIAICMALFALQLRVSTRQRESNRIMIEARGLPGGGRMAILASLRKPERYVIRIVGFLEIGQVTADTGGRCSSVFTSSVACRAIQRCVHSGKSVACERGVIKSGVLPIVNRVAVFARRGEFCGNVVWRSGLLECSLMAGITLNR